MAAHDKRHCIFIQNMMTSSNGNIFRVTGLCAGNSPVTGDFPPQRPVTWSFDVFFHLRLNKRLSKQSWGWWFETPSRPLWRHCNAYSIFISKITRAWYMFGTLRNNRGRSLQTTLKYLYFHSKFTLHLLLRVKITPVLFEGIGLVLNWWQTISRIMPYKCTIKGECA